MTPESGGGGDRKTSRLLGAVLAGGSSRRFGRDKTAASVGGTPMIERAVGALRPVCDEVVVVSSRADTPPGEWRVIPDLRSEGGPLAGIEAALVEARQKGLGAVFVLAADLPLVGVAVGEALAGAYCDRAESGAPVDAMAIARNGEPPFEPLCAIYSVECLGVAGGLLDAGDAAAQGLFSTVLGSTLTVTDDVASVNVNTPADRERAEARLGRADEQVDRDQEASTERPDPVDRAP